MVEFLKSVNVKKVGNISLIIAVSVIAYYSLSAYKMYLEIKEIKKINE